VAKLEFPTKKVIEVKGEKEGGAPSTPAAPNPRTDIGGTSTPPEKKDDNAGMPQKDFSKNYPDRYTPPGMIRNSRGNLVYY
jgi:hypothetical protein